MLKDIRSNPLTNTDSYNLSHQRLKINADWEVSHVYNRAGDYGGQILYGFNEMVLDILNVRITDEHVWGLKRGADQQGLKAPIELFHKVVKDLDGFIPLKVEQLPEGIWCPNGTPFAQVSNTVEGFGELVTWWEARMLHSHFASSCATEAFQIWKYKNKKAAEYNLDLTWKFHSFGFRGHRSLEDAYWAGTSWNLFLQGTDDFHTTVHTPNAPIGSIAALAHKVTQQFDDEFSCYKRAVYTTAEAGEGMVALVIDTYDADNFIENMLVSIAAIAKQENVRIVARPDSGDIWGQTVAIWKKVKQYNLTNVGVIIGESMSFDNAKKCDEFLSSQGIPLDFVAYGIGAGFYKHIDRDTNGWAMKTAYSNGADRMKFGMTPLKRSIPGVVDVIKRGDVMTVVPKENVYGEPGLYNTVYNWELGMEEPMTKQADWNETQVRAKEQNDEQKVIAISSEIADKIEVFREKYVRRG